MLRRSATSSAWHAWLARLCQRPQVQAIIRKLAPLAARPWYPVLGGVIAYAAAVTMTLPTVPVLSALVSLRPQLWRVILGCAVLGSAAGATTLTWLLGRLSLPWLSARMPELMSSPHWQHFAAQVDQYGWWALAIVAVTPISLLPLLALAAMVNMSLLAVFWGVALGKSLKYGMVARGTAIVFSKALPERNR